MTGGRSASFAEETITQESTIPSVQQQLVSGNSSSPSPTPSPVDPSATFDYAVVDALPLVEHNPYALVLALIPLLTIFGNCLVILAVRRDKSLQTVTNLLIVSLASADLLVAICVMFFAVYFEWNSFVWDLGPTLCNLYIGADVACSTASILNLLAISIDRYIAISHPLAYCQVGTKNPRAYLSIALVWMLSIAVAVPVAFGANHIERENECSFTNPLFMIGSSLLSFFLPCLAMIALYAVIFRRLRERERARDMRKQRKTVMGVECALISNALMGGARMARQIAKSHLRDHLLLELSLQTGSSFHTGGSASDEEEDEMEGEDEEELLDQQSESGSSTQRRRRRRRSRLGSQQQGRPTYYSMMLNGGTNAANNPFPLAPIMSQMFALPSVGQAIARPNLVVSKQKDGRRRQQQTCGGGGGSSKSTQRQRLTRTATLLRRCNTLPNTSRALLRAAMGDSGSSGANVFHEEEINDTREIEAVDNDTNNNNINDANNNNNERNGPTATYRLKGMERSEANGKEEKKEQQLLKGVEDQQREQQWHEKERSFGDNEVFPFIDNSSGGGSPASRNFVVLRRKGIGGHQGLDYLKQRLIASGGDNQLQQQQRRTKSVETAFRLSLGLPSNRFSLPNLLMERNQLMKEKTEENGHELDRERRMNDWWCKKTAEDTNGQRLQSGQVPSDNNYSPHGRLGRWLNRLWHRDRAGKVCLAASQLLTVTACPPPAVVANGTNSNNPVVSPSFKDASNVQQQRKSLLPVSGNGRSVRISGTIAVHRQRENGQCAMTGTKGGVVPSSPFRRLRHAFHRSLLLAREETRRPSRQLIKRATRQMRREHKATVTLAVVLAVFLCCWVPFFALHLSNAVCLLGGGQHCVHMLAMFLSTWLGYLNSSLNPLIYTVFDKRFRKAFRELLGCSTPYSGGGRQNRQQQQRSAAATRQR